MATKKCSPNPEPRHYQRMAEMDPLGEVIRLTEDFGKTADSRVEAREGFYDRASGLITEVVNELNMPMGEVLEYLQSRIGPIDELTKTQPGVFAAVLKTYVESKAGATREVAQGFLNKVNSGMEPTLEGVAFMKYMKELAKINDTILGFDQQVGRNMLMQRQDIRKGLFSPNKDVGDAAAKQVQADAEAAKQMKTIFEDISDDMKNPGTAPRGVQKIVDMAETITFMDNPEKIFKASGGLNQIASNVVSEYMINGMLSSPATWTTNASGMLWVPLKAFFTTAGAYPMGVLTGDMKQAQVTFQQGLAALSAMYSSLGESAQLAWQALKTEKGVYTPVREPAIRATMSGPTGEMLTEKYGLDTAQNLIQMNNQLGSFLRLPSRFLLSADEFAKNMAIRGEVAMRGVQNAFTEGIDMGDAAAVKARLRKEADDAFLIQGKTGLSEGINSVYEKESFDKFGKTVRQVAEEGTFQEASQWANTVNQALNKMPVLKPFLPFVRTPINILKQGALESTGVSSGYEALRRIAGATISGETPQSAIIKMQADMLKNPQEAARMAGQIAFTGSLAALVYSLAQQTDPETGRQILSGGGPGAYYGMTTTKGQGAQRVWEMAGNSRHTLHLGGTDIPLSRFGEPLGIVMRIVANIATLAAFIPQEDQDMVMGGTVSLAASGLYDASFLKGVGDLMDLVQAEGRQKERYLTENVQNWVAAFTPMGGLLATVARVDDPYRKARGKGSFTDLLTGWEEQASVGILSKAAARVPGNGLPTRHDQILGQPVPLYPGQGPRGISIAEATVPFWPREADKANPAVIAWQRLVGSYTDYNPARSRKGFEITPEEQQELNILMGTMRINGKTFAESIMEVYNTTAAQEYLEARKPTVYGPTENAFADELNKIKRKFGQTAFTRMTMTNDGLLVRFNTYERIKALKKQNQTDEAVSLQGSLDDLYQRARRGF